MCCGHSSYHVPVGGGTLVWQSQQRVRALALGKQDASGQETLLIAPSYALCAGSHCGRHREGPIGTKPGHRSCLFFFVVWEWSFLPKGRRL